MRTSVNSAAVQSTVRAVADRLAAASEDDIVSHDELKSLIPASLLDRGYNHYIFAQRAQNLLNKESGLIFCCVPREGYRRLSLVVGSQYEVSRGFRRIRKGAQRIRTRVLNSITRANDATPSQIREAHQAVNTASLLEHIATMKTLRTAPADQSSSTERDNFPWLRQFIGER